MRFNKYIWDLYKNTDKGRECIDKWSNYDFPDNEFCRDCKPEILEKLNQCDLGQYIIDSKVNWYKLLKDYFINEFNIDDAVITFKNWINEGIYINGFKIISKNNFKHWAIDIQFFSKVLYSTFPDYFFPYTMDCGFNKFRKVCDEFNITIPEVPKKMEWQGRATYYLDLCESLLEFRKVNAFTPAELCALLYDFAPSVLQELDDNELPNPSKVWFVGGSKHDFDF